MIIFPRAVNYLPDEIKFWHNKRSFTKIERSKKDQDPGFWHLFTEILSEKFCLKDLRIGQIVNETKFY